jgi:hypothetical protein
MCDYVSVRNTYKRKKIFRGETSYPEKTRGGGLGKPLLRQQRVIFAAR